MTPRMAWITIAGLASSLILGEPTARADEPPAAVEAKPAAAPVPRPSTLSLPSAVSPAIERFVRQSGRDVPPTPAPPVLPRSGAGRPVRAQQGPAGREVPRRFLPLPSATTRPPLDLAAPVGPSPLATSPRLSAAPLAPDDLRFPINLAAALRLSDARPLIVAAAQARVWVAEAELAQAKVLWLADVVVAVDYIRHDGGGPDFNKGILTAPSTNFFFAGGALYGVIPTTDAVYGPLVARRVLTSRHFDIQTAKNDALHQTADAYFQVHRSRGRYAGALYTVSLGHDLTRRLAELSRDLASQYEVDRARNMVADLEQQAAQARQEWRVDSARLTRVLRLDPRAVVEPLERDHLQITLIDPARSLDDLMPIALLNRPEIGSWHALVGAAEIGIRREKARPFIPQILLTGFNPPGGMQIQAGIFGLGANSSLNQWTGRDDISIQLVWQLEHFGIGNLARIKAQRGMESRAIIELRKAQDRVAEEVNAAHARLQSATTRVSQADRSLRTGIIAYNGTVEGLEHTTRFGDVLVLISRPQEAVYSLQMLKRAFDEYFTTVADYNVAQFELFRALGYPAAEIALRRSPGDLAPVDTSRPVYLPPVGNGPPPATR